jgi:hypothetical protein
MKTTWIRVIFLTAALLSPFTFVVRAARESWDSRQGHLSGLTARITQRDGITRVVRIEGVGCSASICSRTLIKGKTDPESVVKTWLDSISVIQEMTSSDALFVLKDGSRRRLYFVGDFRVLYLETRLGISEKLDFALVKSVEFLPAST